MIVGAGVFDNGQSDEGRVFVYHGSAAGLGTSAAWTAEPNQSNARFGSSVATAGDVNGDGFSDVIVGAPSFNGGQSEEGRAFVYHGSAAGLALLPAWTKESDQTDAYFGFSVGAAGDVNGDGYGDVLVGAPRYDNGELDEGRAFVYMGSPAGLAGTPAWTAEGDQEGASFGISAATAGDVNGDGYSDIIVGSHLYDNGEINEGAAFVYLGSSTGLATTPAWTTESNQADAFLGLPAQTAGDVNGDGYSDVVVGASFFDGGQVEEGRAYVYEGSAAGLSDTPAWIAEGDQVNALFGTWVASAGDVNGDGFSDVAVGASFFSNGEEREGRAYVYQGSADGLATTPAWTAESNQADARFGGRVETAGDVNGDGYSDIIVGAHLYHNGQSSEGGAFLYQGSPAGLAVSPAWTAESNQAGAQFGISVGTAGDVNSDGFSDVIVSAYWYENGQAAEGRAFVYLGSAEGLSTLPDWTAEGDRVGARFGSQVGTAGDVNGDGYSDVIVGAYQFSNGQVEEGRAFLFYGNGGGGLVRLPRQARTDDSAPISLLGTSDSESAFRVKALGRTAAGRGRVQLQIEVKPAGTPFDGSGVVTTPAVDTGMPTANGSAVPLTELASGLTAETLYHWRLRVDADSPFFPRSPWFTLAGNALTEADLRTAAAIPSDASGFPSASNALLGPGTPNPFTDGIDIMYTLSARGHVRLAAHDVAGRQVAVLAEGAREAGRHDLRWDGHDSAGDALPAGVYLLRLETAGRVTSRKLVIAR